MRRNQFLYLDPVTSRLWLSIWGMVIAFPERERMHAMSYALHDDFDRGLQEFIAARLSAGQVFVDVGASVGVLTTIGARMVGPAGQVLAVEPLAHLCEAVRGNLSRNAASTPVQVLQAAALDRAAELVLDVYDEDSRIGTLYAYGGDALQGARTQVPVQTVRLDAVCPPGRPVDLVKIDAEGAELFVLRGLEGVLERSPGIGIIIEWGPSNFARAGYGAQDVTAWAQAHGFTMQSIHPVNGALEPFDPASGAANVLLSRPAA